MARKDDFEQRYFNQIDDNAKNIRVDIQDVKAEIQKLSTTVNGRLTKIEKKVFPEKLETIQQLPPFWRDPQLVKLFTIIAAAIVIFLVIFAALKGIQLPKLF